MLGFFQDQVLSAARPEGLEGGLGKDVTIRRAIDVAEPKIATAFPDQPITEASVRSVLGETYYYLGEPALSARQRELALELRMAELGPDHPDMLNLQTSLALSYWAAGQHDRAIPLLKRTLTATVGRAGRRPPRHAHHPEQPRARLPGRRSGRQGDPAAGKDGRGAFARLGADHPDTLISQNNLANAYRVAGQFARALPLSERTVAAQTARLGTDHPDTITSRNTLANVYRDTGRNDRAIPMLERTLAAGTVKLGLDHPRVLITRSILASAYLSAGWPDRSITLLEADGGGPGGEARRRPPRHARQPDQPRECLPRRRPERPGDSDARADAGDADRQARRRPRQDAGHAEKPRQFVSLRRLVGPVGPAPGADDSRPRRRGWAPTIPTRSPPRTTSRTRTATPARMAGRSACSSGLSSMRKAKLGVDHPGTLTTLVRSGGGLPGGGRFHPGRVAVSRRPRRT